jgi:coproporphyrinogen III oxidase-like Fe-S oxidoreductase
MKYSSVDFCRESEWIYRQFAKENEIDYLQLRLIDLLFCRAGVMSLAQVQECMPYSRLVIKETIEDLAAQDLVEWQGDQLALTDYAPFVVEDILLELHEKLQAVSTLLGAGEEEESPHLVA